MNVPVIGVVGIVVVQTGLSLLVLYQGRLIGKLKAERMRRAEELLTGMVRVGPLDLPAPEDPRWAAGTIACRSPATGVETKRPVLRLASVEVSDQNFVYIGHEVSGLADAALVAYAKRVWIEHRKRAVRTAVQKLDQP